jgi:TatD DNase family protein
MVDTHCHLDACEEPVADLAERARAAGVTRLLAIGMSSDSCRHALEAASGQEEVYVALGRHPHESAGFDQVGLEEIEQLAAYPKVRAIGEAGLDYHRDYAPREDQRLAFSLQIELAQQLHLPLVVHTRDAENETFKALEQGASSGIPVIMHCFSLVDWVDECIERGYYCSFAGNVTYPKATALQQAAERVPDELLLVETDAPFLAPQEYRGKPNEPAYVRSTASFLAALRGQTYAELERVVESNAGWIFRW